MPSELHLLAFEALDKCLPESVLGDSDHEVGDNFRPCCFRLVWIGDLELYTSMVSSDHAVDFGTLTKVAALDHNIGHNLEEARSSTIGLPNVRHQMHQTIEG